MAQAQLDSGSTSAFCESIAMVLAAGIQVDEGLAMLSEGMKDEALKPVCDKLYADVSRGDKLSASMAETGAFDDYAVQMVQAGERSGRLENVMRSLSIYYDEESRLISKARMSVTYPAILMLIMTVILAFTVANILPVFMNAYESLAGTITGGSAGAIGMSFGIGWVAFIIMFTCAVIALACAAGIRSPRGRKRIGVIAERFPLSREAGYKLALSRFTSAYSTYVCAGSTTEAALENAKETVSNPLLREKLDASYADMTDPDEPLGLAQAFSKNSVFDALSLRMLTVSARSGSLEHTLDKLSTTYFDEAVTRIDALIDEIEPALAAFLTIAVGATLISVMIPLIGIMGSIG